MSGSSGTTGGRSQTYSSIIHQPLHNLVFVLPLLIFFHIGTAWCGTSLLAPRDIYRLLRYFGATAGYLPPALVVLVLLVQHVLQRRKWQIQSQAMAGMLAEAIMWSIPLVGLSYMTGKVISQAALLTPAGNEFLQQMLLAVGAGLYEEFIFRLVLISLLMLLFVDVFALKKEPVVVGAVLVTAVLFSLYHFAGAAPEAQAGFPWAEFTFRAIAGIYLGGLYVFRGFAVAVGAHAFFDIYVVIANF